MKGWMKGMLIASAVCIGAGTAMCASAWAMGGRFSQFRHRRVGLAEEETIVEEPMDIPSQGAEAAESVESQSFGEPPESSAVVSPDRTAVFGGAAIAKLEIKVTGGKAELIADDAAESIRVICENEIYGCHQKVEGDTLEIKIEPQGKKDKSFWKQLEQWEDWDEWDEAVVQIVIPAGSHFREADLEVSGGALTADYLYADSLDMEVSGGILNVQGGIAGKLKGECMAGSLVYEGQALREADAECEAGSVRYLLEGREEDFNYEIDVSVGSILISGTEQGNMNDEKVVRNTGAAKHAELECSAGKIQIDFYQP